MATFTEHAQKSSNREEEAAEAAVDRKSGINKRTASRVLQIKYIYCISNCIYNASNNVDAHSGALVHFLRCSHINLQTRDDVLKFAL